MKTVEKIEKLNKNLSNIAAFVDVIVACVSAPFAAARGVRHDIMNPKNIDKKLKFCDLYRRHFRDHITANNSLKFYIRSLERGDARLAKVSVQKYNPVFEISEKGLDGVLYNLSNQDIITVRYFEATEHQEPVPMRCRFGDYMINFAPSGTKWCDGIQGNGYVFKLDKESGYRQIATLSPQLSNYLANIADEKFKIQQQQLSISR